MKSRFDRLYKTIMEETNTSKKKVRKIIKEDVNQDQAISNRIKEVIYNNGIEVEFKEPITDDCIVKLSAVESLRNAILNNADELEIEDEIFDALNTVCNLTQKTEDDKFEERMRIEDHQKRVHKDTTFGPDSDCYDAVRSIFRDCLEFDIENSDYDLGEVDIDGLVNDYFEDCLEDAEVKAALQAYVADTEGKTDAYDNLQNDINYWIMDNIVNDLENKACFGEDWQWS